MKKILLSSALMLLAITFSVAQTTAPAKPVENKNQAEFKFEKEVHDFGTIKEGVQAEYTFKFTNIGKEPLVISNVQASCGCTTPKWTKEPVKPGDVGSITVVYNSKGRPGMFNKSVTITSNAKTSSKVLFIKGTVEASAAATSSNETAPVRKESAGPVENKK